VRRAVKFPISSLGIIVIISRDYINHTPCSTIRAALVQITISQIDIRLAAVSVDRLVLLYEQRIFWIAVIGMRNSGPDNIAYNDEADKQNRDGQYAHRQRKVRLKHIVIIVRPEMGV